MGQNRQHNRFPGRKIKQSEGRGTCVIWPTPRSSISESPVIRHEWDIRTKFKWEPMAEREAYPLASTKVSPGNGAQY